MAVKKIVTAFFKEEVLESSQTVIVDFWAEWCGPCRMLGPVIEEVSEAFPDVKVMKCNVDENMDLAMEYKIDAIPAVLKFKGGQVVDKLIGFAPKDEVKKFFER